MLFMLKIDKYITARSRISEFYVYLVKKSILMAVFLVVMGCTNHRQAELEKLADHSFEKLELLHSEEDHNEYNQEGYFLYQYALTATDAKVLKRNRSLKPMPKELASSGIWALHLPAEGTYLYLQKESGRKKTWVVYDQKTTIWYFSQY
jgi:uncharacterized lipoprotein NlpE involved in copper resistance